MALDPLLSAVAADNRVRGNFPVLSCSLEHGLYVVPDCYTLGDLQLTVFMVMDGYPYIALRSARLSFI